MSIRGGGVGGRLPSEGWLCCVMHFWIPSAFLPLSFAFDFWNSLLGVFYGDFFAILHLPFYVLKCGEITLKSLSFSISQSAFTISVENDLVFIYRHGRVICEVGIV